MASCWNAGRNVRSITADVRGLATTVSLRTCRRASDRLPTVRLSLCRPSTDLRRFSIGRATRTPSASAVLQRRHETPTERYQQLVDRGLLNKDEHQLKVVERLEELHDRLAQYNPPELEPPTLSQSILTRLFGGSKTSSTPVHPLPPPQGLYLYGDVGTGKTMLMDLFFDSLPANIRRKRRVHFHAFMIEVHRRIHEVKAQLGGREMGDPIPRVAREIANEGVVLCFDEFQVTDIADAMILRMLMERLLDLGVVFVMTSNRHPDDLYKNGIQRESFLPCIRLLKERLHVVDLDSGKDYRRMLKTLSKVYYHPLDDTTRSEISKLFTALSHGEEVMRDRHLMVWGRPVPIPECTTKVARFTFHQLCGMPLSAADYLEITKEFPTIFVVEVPKMGLNEKDLARRFITFIDACYESKTKLFVSSEVPIFQIFSDEKPGEGLSDHARSVMDDLGLSDTTVGASSLFSGDEEIFAFARAVSRLVQMGTKQWAETAGQS